MRRLLLPVCLALAGAPARVGAASDLPLAAGAMGTAREGHTATLLTDGKVLVVGGAGESGVLSSAELYGPEAVPHWAQTGSLGTGRYRHSATPLPDGKVLVAGGNDGHKPLPSAELYDPASGTWTRTGAMKTARDAHVAILLADGRVLAAGGFTGRQVLASAEIYDPNTGEWRATAPLAAGRYGAAAALLPDGKVLVSGGVGPGFRWTAELFDPRGAGGAGSWSEAGSMKEGRAFHTETVLPGGKVLVAGGRGERSLALASAEIYDPATSSTWTTTGSMVVARAFHTATPLNNGTVLVAGGHGAKGSTPPLPLEAYDPATGAWKAAGHAPAINWRKDTYDSSLDMWRSMGHFETARYRHAATLLPGGQVLLTGGYADGTLASAELLSVGDYDLAPAPAPAPAAAPAAAQPAAAKVGLESGYWVQLAAYIDASQAEALRSTLKAAGESVEVFPVKVDDVLYNRVRLGPFATLAEARKAVKNHVAEDTPAEIIWPSVAKSSDPGAP